MVASRAAGDLPVVRVRAAAPADAGAGDPSVGHSPLRRGDTAATLDVPVPGDPWEAGESNPPASLRACGGSGAGAQVRCRLGSVVRW